MVMSYETEKVKFPSRVKDPSQETEYLMQDGNMKDRYLGQCLDSCRWGSLETVLYEMNAFQMVGFIKNWVKQNRDSLKFHFEKVPPDLELPYIKREKCPRNSDHRLKNKGLDGTVRCIDEDVKKFRRGSFESEIYYDSLSQSRRKEYHKVNPVSYKNLRNEGYEKDFIDKIKKSSVLRKTFGIEPKGTVILKERCGAILSDKESVIPLVEIIDRLDVFPGSMYYCRGKCKDPFLNEFELDRACFGHKVNDHLEFPFDGWHLSWIVEKWYEQPPKGSAPFTTLEATERIMGKIKPF
jgi:hypothetical protein